jgi:hypothetical protein
MVVFGEGVEKLDPSRDDGKVFGVDGCCPHE